MNTTITWHRPLIALAALMGVLAIAIGVAAVVDPRELLGTNLWFKPLKFALSIGIYAVTLACSSASSASSARLHGSPAS